MIKTILLIIITIFIPPIGVFLVAGCGADLLINILLTILGYFPGHIHAFYVEYVYFKRRDEIRAGIVDARRAPGVYSSKVQRGGTHVQPPPPVQTGAPPRPPPPGPAQQPYTNVPPQGQQGYGTI
ncbi:UPF0057-domain-containing protein [Aaosphaeria arxii CBS 175.79]|uniref:UPF0057-domain-containing protein n=1 Tax=Aaosphaeria arxii CBS 175.79 TaxID=1450172 RepID=A0A6A5Y6J1_9PLEO|nr:UPF0057-domain-containing protein [Aaosphaeria arxii CBS 175.79]KAF2021182.1 UPF0057-domain-containing protein [Aaosphaeria arxii CBS 175.79]